MVRSVTEHRVNWNAEIPIRGSFSDALAFAIASGVANYLIITWSVLHRCGDANPCAYQPHHWMLRLFGPELAAFVIGVGLPARWQQVLAVTGVLAFTATVAFVY
jgi:hypothetical protein